MSLVLKASADLATLSTPCLVIPVAADNTLSEHAQLLDQTLDGAISKLLKRGDLNTDNGSTLILPLLQATKAERLMLVRLEQPLTTVSVSKALKNSFEALQALNIAAGTIDLRAMNVQDSNEAWLAEQAALQFELSGYQYHQTLSKPKAANTLKKMTVLIATNQATRQSAANGTAIGKGMNTARELGNLPGNICTPSYLAKQAKALARTHNNLTVTVLNEKKMRELGMGALLSVTAGTAEAAQLIVMEYQGGSKKQKPHALVGKGVTFDSGGISLKPGARMDEMKYDMCGAASVLGTMITLTELALPINVVGIIGAVENMPSGTATKPGDVVTSMSGQTIEVLNTDAEGRLVLCDALTYVGRFKPASVIDIATLTGACVVALGNHATGLYSNQDDFAAELLAAGNAVGDRAWHMPLWDDYQPQLNSRFADMGNVGGPEGGSITAACFLSRFTKEYRWAHLDIAGTAWLSGPQKGATGRPVALLSQYLINKSR
jgi:leucyl aminopeptidase